MSEEIQITFAHGTDVGRVRDHNEDSVAVFEPAEPAMQRKGRLFIVADGMGGYLAGEVASQMAAETVQREYYADPSDEPATRLQNAVQAANAAVFDSAHSNRAHSGMGTTMVATALIGHKAYVAAVGDSRVYVFHQDQLSQVTQDHSFVGEQVRAGLLTKEQARLHPQRNVVTRALGSQPAVQVDLFEGDLAEGDMLLMCSDGLTGHVPEDRIRDTLCQLPPAQAVQRLIELANEGGGSDNISAIVLCVECAPKTKRDTQPTVARAMGTSAMGTSAMGTSPTHSEPARKARGISLTWVALGGGVVLAGMAIVGMLALGMGGFWLWENKLKVTPTPTPTSARPLFTVTPLPVIEPTPSLLPPTPTFAPTLAPREAVSATPTLEATVTATVTTAMYPSPPTGTRGAAPEGGTGAPPTASPTPKP